MPLDAIEAPGIKAEGNVLSTMRSEVARLLDRKIHSFPGAQPVSFSRQHLEELTKQDYYVCEKSDGMRYLLYLTEDEVGNESQYLIDRKNDYWWIPPDTLHFPIPRDQQGFHRNTLIDGELVMDKVAEGGLQPKYLVFDCMVLDGNSLMSRTLDKRLAYFKERVYDPYKQLLKDFPQELEHQYFIMQLKAMQFSYAIDMMFQKILPNLPHGNDGLIFTCRTTEYKHGTDPNILKWKPEEENSIDFRLRLEFPRVQPDEQDIAEGYTKPYHDYDAMPICNLHVFAGDGNEDPWFACMYIEPAEWVSLKSLQQPLNDRIVECFMDSQKRWRYMRFRDDKLQANHTSTVNSVMKSIFDRVTEKDLRVAQTLIREKWKMREAEADAERKRGMKRKADEQANRRQSPGPPVKS